MGSLSGSKVAVIGGGGFIGTHLCNALATAGATVTALGRSRLDASAADPRVAWSSCELCNTARLRELIAAEVVYLLAGTTAPALAESDPASEVADYVAPSARLMALAAELGVRRLVFVSSVKDSDAPPVELACCFDGAYIVPTAIMATSILAHASPDRRYILHLVYDGSDDAPLDAFERFSGTRLEVRLVKARNVFAGAATAYPGMPPVSFLRLALADLLPNVPKVLSIDPDMICLTNVAPCFDTELGDAPMAAVVDLAMANGLAGEIKEGRPNREGSKHRYFAGRLGLDLQAMGRYFNAGLMLFDLERFRREGFFERAQAFVAAPGETLRWSEQCVLNAFFGRVYKPLPDRWNVLLDPPRPRDYGAGGLALIGRAGEARNDPAILHFNWKTKPWLRAFIPTGQAKTWWAYALAAPVHWRLKLREPLATRRLVRALLEPSVLVRAVRVRRLLRARLASRFRRGD